MYAVRSVLDEGTALIQVELYRRQFGRGAALGRATGCGKTIPSSRAIAYAGGTSLYLTWLAHAHLDASEIEQSTTRNAARDRWFGGPGWECLPMVSAVSVRDRRCGNRAIRFQPVPFESPRILETARFLQ